MPIDAWITLGALVLMFVALVREWFGADVVVFGALIALWLLGIVDSDQALAGFSNVNVITIACLFIVSTAMQDTGALDRITRVMLGPNLDRRRGFARLLAPIAGLSAFMNNTPLVAIMTPAVREWAIHRGKAPSKFLIPISYAAILGGTCTLIGTSTNLVVSGLLEENGFAPFGMFELAAVGLPATAVGLLYLLAFGQRLLPARRAPGIDPAAEAREYAVRLEVLPECPFIGQTVEQAGLRQLSGLFLAEIERGGERILPVKPSTKVQLGDRLVLFGVAETVVELRKTKGLAPVGDVEGDDEPPVREGSLFEVVVSAGSPLVGTTLKDAGFRRRYDAAVIAIHRNGERLHMKLGDVELRSGDTLMVEASPGFHATWGKSTDFYLVAQVEKAERPRYALSSVALSILIAMVALITLDVLTPVLAASAAALTLVLTRCVRASNARNAVNLQVIIVIAASFGLSAAVVESGLGAGIGGLVISVFGGFRPWVVLAVIYLLTAAFTELLSNNAAAALVMPIALATSTQLGVTHGMDVDPRPYAVAVAIAASASFITPLGYQTNLIVYGPGGYKFHDFAKIGVPMAILVFITAMVCIPSFWPLT